MSTIEKTQLIDWEQTVHLAGEDADLAKDILTLTYRSLPTDLEEISLAIKDVDERELRRLLHKLEGGISYVKLPVLESATLALHEAVNNSENDKYTALFNTLHEAINATINAIQEQINLLK